ncbi:MAG: glycosyltransferase [Thermomicrobiales bacterium]
MLFTFAGGSGHFLPLTPIAREAMRSGHVVAFAGQTAMISTIERAGFAAFDTGGSTLRTSPEIIPLLPPDIEREEGAIRNGFALRTARTRADALLPLCTEWKPDVVVCDEVDFGAMIVAERLGIPHATVIVLAAGAFTRTDVIADSLNVVRKEHGLPADPDAIMPGRDLIISPVPPSFRDPRYPLPETAHAIRPYVLESIETDDVPAWIADLGKLPVVYFTLGTIFNLESGDLFQRVLAGLRDLPVDVVVTVGRELDPEVLGDQPPHVRIEQFIPQAALLPHCDLVISHGGSGSVIGSLAFGLPQVLIPMGADQLHNAERGEALGFARVLDPITLTPEDIRKVTAEMLADTNSRECAQRSANEIVALPGSEYAVQLLERLGPQTLESTFSN